MEDIENMTSNNITNSSSDPITSPLEEYTLADVIITSILYYGISTCGVVATILVLIAIITTPTFHTSGYALLASLGICELVSSILKSFISHSLSLYTWSSSSHSTVPPTLLHAAGLISIFAYEAAVFHMLLIAVNRLFAVVFYSRYSRLFTRPTTCRLIIIAWLLALGSVYPQLHGYCQYLYQPSRWSYVLPPGRNNFIYFIYHQGIAIFYVIASSTIYAITWHKIRKVRHRARSKRAVATSAGPRAEDIQLTLQFFIVSCVFVVSWIFLAINLVGARMLTSTNPLALKYLTIARNIFWFINHSINSFIYLAINARLRKRVLALMAQVNMIGSTCSRSTVNEINMGMMQKNGRDETSEDLSNGNKSTTFSSA